jgi:hypothetical protein
MNYGRPQDLFFAASRAHFLTVDGKFQQSKYLFEKILCLLVARIDIAHTLYRYGVHFCAVQSLSLARETYQYQD